jgi:hypothetical protein
VGTVFKKQVTRPVPAGAEVIVRKGRSCARWQDRKGKTRVAPLTTGKGGGRRIVTESLFYVAQYRDGAGVLRVESTGCRDETTARKVLFDLERQAELVRTGVVTPAEAVIGAQQGVPFSRHVAAYAEHLAAKQVGEVHQQNTVRYLRRLAADCPFATLADLRREALERWLAARAAEGMSARSRNAYRNALVAFGNWSVATCRLTPSPTPPRPTRRPTPAGNGGR